MIRVIRLLRREAVNHEEVRLLRHWYQRAMTGVRLLVLQESSQTAGFMGLVTGGGTVWAHKARKNFVLLWLVAR